MCIPCFRAQKFRNWGEVRKQSERGSVMSVHSLVRLLPYNQENCSSLQLVYRGYGDQSLTHARLALHHGAPVLALAPGFR